MPVRELSSSFQITLFFFNPNIHPYKEALERLESVKTLAKEYQLPLLIGDYPYQPFLSSILELSDSSSPSRCNTCYQVRLSKSRHMALEHQIPYFSTTLLYSKYQNHEAIVANAQELDRESPSPAFYYQDFRPFFDEGQKLAREKNYYMQKYCGCIFSNEDRYKKSSHFGNNLIRNQ
jgi:hypothetical protein